MSKLPCDKPKSPRSGCPVPSNPSGRPKGSVNKIGKTTKENYEAIFEAIGGVGYAVIFLKAHPRAMEKFLTETYTRLLPLDMKMSGGLGLVIQRVDRIVETVKES
jgi:hypothetical protein